MKRLRLWLAFFAPRASSNPEESTARARYTQALRSRVLHDRLRALRPLAPPRVWRHPRLFSRIDSATAFFGAPANFCFRVQSPW